MHLNSENIIVPNLKEEKHSTQEFFYSIGTNIYSMWYAHVHTPHLIFEIKWNNSTASRNHDTKEHISCKFSSFFLSSFLYIQGTTKHVPVWPFLG